MYLFLKAKSYFENCIQNTRPWWFEYFMKIFVSYVPINGLFQKNILFHFTNHLNFNECFLNDTGHQYELYRGEELFVKKYYNFLK